MRRKVILALKLYCVPYVIRIERKLVLRIVLNNLTYSQELYSAAAYGTLMFLKAIVAYTGICGAINVGPRYSRALIRGDANTATGINPLL